MSTSQGRPKQKTNLQVIELGSHKVKTKCTFPGCTDTALFSGERNGWSYALCKEHKDFMMPFLSNEGLSTQVVNK